MFFFTLNYFVSSKTFYTFAKQLRQTYEQQVYA